MTRLTPEFFEALSDATGVPVEALRTLAGISAPDNEREFNEQSLARRLREMKSRKTPVEGDEGQPK